MPLIHAAQAHEKWFVPVDPVTSPVPGFYTSLNPVTLSALLAVFIVTVLGLWATRKYDASAFGRRVEAAIRPWRDYGAGLLAFCTGFTMLFMSVKGVHIAPNYPLEPTVFESVVRVAQGAVGALLMIGLYTPFAAVGMLVLYLAAFLLHPASEPVDYLNFVGISVFLFTFARGRYSLDWFLGKPILSTPQQRKWAYLFLRVTTGIALVWLAALKIRRPDLHFSLMDRFSDWNPYVLLGMLGLHMTRETYVLLLAVVEGTVGIFETFGILTRPASVLLIPVMLGSVLFLGPAELVGHLPILGTLFVLIIYGDDYYKNRLPDRYAAHPVHK